MTIECRNIPESSKTNRRQDDEGAGCLSSWCVLGEVEEPSGIANEAKGYKTGLYGIYNSSKWKWATERVRNRQQSLSLIVLPRSPNLSACMHTLRELLERTSSFSERIPPSRLSAFPKFRQPMTPIELVDRAIQEGLFWTKGQAKRLTRR